MTTAETDTTADRTESARTRCSSWTSSASPRASSTTCPTSRRSAGRVPRPTSAPSCPPSPAPPSRPSSPAPPPPSTASSPTAGTSASSATSCCGASTTGSSPATSSGTRPAAATPATRVANICWWYAMGADTDITVTPAARLLRRRPQGTRLLHPAAGPARRTHRETRHVPPLPLLGPGRRPRLLAVDRRRDPAHHRHPPSRPGPGLRPPPRLRPPALRPRRPALAPGGGRARRAPSRRCSTTPRPRAAPSSPSPSTASPASIGPSTSTAPCAAPDSSKCTRRTAWSTSTR